MYKRIVRPRVPDTFASISDGNYQVMVDSLAPSFAYRLHGEHALGGYRTSREAMTLWWQRLMRLLPGGVRYENTMIQLMTLAWGKVTEVATLEDLQVLQRALEAMAGAGTEEAVAAPIQG